MGIGNEYLRSVIERFKSVKKLGDKTLEQLSEDEIKWAYNKESNNISVIVKHLSGNMVSRWKDLFNSDGEKSGRNRDEEFIDDLHSKTEVLYLWEMGWDVLFGTLTGLREEDLLKPITIRGEQHSVIAAIERQMAHYSYHVGQIVYIGKQIKDDAWQSLSIPRGKSVEYLNQMLKNQESKN